MCGIAGLWDTSERTGPEELKRIARAMSDALRHRGPDAAGVWVHEAGVAFGHRRLAILDLSSEGHQPMTDRSGRYTVCFNGEIYNYAHLAAEIGGPWRGGSDTEVLLEAVARWGVRAATERFVGMFAFALWDGQERALYLVRDRAGQKPLYWSRMGDRWVFSSELSSMEAVPGFDRRIDRGALASLLRYNYIGAPHSIYEAVHKLPPGTILRLGEEPRPYWSAAEIALEPVAPCTDRDALHRIEEALSIAVKRRMVSDVPLGALLSGGIDSSLIVALMCEHATGPVKTFTIGFRSPEFNEATHAAAVAGHLGTEHTELYVDESDALRAVELLPSIYDEPFGDASQLPTRLVCALAREHVTVALAGDGGDELFYGYERYQRILAQWGRLKRIPRSARRAAALGTRLGGRLLEPLLGQRRARRMPWLLDTPDVDTLYAQGVCHVLDPERLVPGATEPRLPHLDARHLWHRPPDPRARVMLLDMLTYLPDDILVKTDRASMSVSLELRAPLLDHEVMETAMRLPMSVKERQGQGKWLLKQLLHTRVPRALVDRPKTGFGVPLASWLRGPLRGWADDLLATDRLRQDAFFDAAAISAIWSAHRSSQEDYSGLLWNILAFQAWNAARQSA